MYILERMSDVTYSCSVQDCRRVELGSVVTSLGVYPTQSQQL